MSKLAEPKKTEHLLAVSITRDPLAIAESQRLRYQIFSQELGARLHVEDGRDVDRYDTFCDHLIIRDTQSNLVVGTYRILPPDRLEAAGGHYSANEFDLSPLKPIFSRTIEIGRSCVHKDYRHGGTIMMLWSALIQYMHHHRYQYMIGCGSLPMNDGGHEACSIYHQLKDKYLAPLALQVTPKNPLNQAILKHDLTVPCPALIKGYLRIGCYIGGAPSVDADFNTADILIMMDMSQMNKRYLAHLIKQ